MAKKEIPINNATATQLAQYANVMCGLDVTPQTGFAKIRALMANAGFEPEAIIIEEKALDEAPKRKVLDGGEKRKFVKIIIPNQEGPGGQLPVPVGVNGRVALIQRGIPVDVPEEYVHVLTNAERVIFDSGKNGELINPRKVPQHPFNIIG